MRRRRAASAHESAVVEGEQARRLMAVGEGHERAVGEAELEVGVASFEIDDRRVVLAVDLGCRRRRNDERAAFWSEDTEDRIALRLVAVGRATSGAASISSFTRRRSRARVPVAVATAPRRRADQNAGVPELSPGDVFAGCRIEAVLGRGGMGVVYRALQLDLGRPVALKVIASDRAADPGFRERFQRESRLAASFDHPHVVPVHGAGEEDGELYIVMRYVRGSDLHQLVKREGRLAPERAAAIVAQVGSALDAAHAAGLVHRDVKPGNVLLAGGGEEEHGYLSDFGLTRRIDPGSQLTESGQWLGTVDFASPEQLHGDRVDARSDVYSLGCVLFAALTGKPPFPRETVPATLLAHLHEPPPRPSAAGLPRELDRVVARALDKEPDRRYPSAGDLGRAAQAAARGESVTESERSVAVGPAAPGSKDATSATAVRSGARGAASVPAAFAPAPARTQIKPVDPRPGPAGDRPAPLEPERMPEHLPRSRRSRRRAIAAAIALPLAGIVTTGVLLLRQPAGGPSRPDDSVALSADEVRAAAQDFADAYEHEDGRALRGVLSSDVQRVLPAGVARGRTAVVKEYERQFRANATQTYELEQLDAEGGTAGRATARYRVTRQAGAALVGKLVLGVVRDHGRARIALIAVTPRA